MKMSGKQTVALDISGYEAGDAPGQAEAVAGTGASAELIDDNQGAVRGGLEHVGGLEHLGHEGGNAS